MLVWSNSVYYCSLLLLLFSHSVVSDSLWSPWTAAHQVSLSFTLSWSLIKLMSIESVMPSNHLILCRPILLLPSIFSSIRVFSNDLAFCTRRPKSIGASASASVLPVNIQDWFHLGWTGWISLMPKGFSRVFSSTTVQKHQFFSTQPSLWSNSHILTWLLEKPYLWLYGPLSAKWCLELSLIYITSVCCIQDSLNCPNSRNPSYF